MQISKASRSFRLPSKKQKIPLFLIFMISCRSERKSKSEGLEEKFILTPTGIQKSITTLFALQEELGK